MSGNVSKEQYRVLGLMSGTSMDGVDLAYCEFVKHEGTWRFGIKCAETIAYPEVWVSRIANLPDQPAVNYVKTDAFYGKYLGQLCRGFIKRNNLPVDLIASHGHTIFHQPQNGFTAQIGDGAAIHAETRLPVVSNFRTTDVALGGQGAPLVPVGDRELFSDYDACLNLGGFANISFTNQQNIKAFDISPCNIIFNHVAGWMGLAYDNGGEIGASGRVDNALLGELNTIEYYRERGSKSLGREWANESFWPVVVRYDYLSNEDMMATFAEHVAFQIAEAINSSSVLKVLTTGGGAFNKHLIGLLSGKCKAEIIIPDDRIIQYKEALIFAFLGLLRVLGDNNCMATATGALRDNLGGALYGKFQPLLYADQ